MSIDERPCLIHIGFPRTGSTALQQNLLVRAPDTVYFGKPLTSFSLPMRRLFVSLLTLERWEWEQRRKRVIEGLLEPLLARPGARLLISDEELSTGPLDARVDRFEIARRLAELVPQAEILLVVRDQLELLRSCYCQLVAIDRVDAQGFRPWVDAQLERPHTFLHLFRISDAAGVWTAHFGPERIHILTHEQLRANPRAFVDALAPLLGLEPERLWSCYRDVRRNRSVRRRWVALERALALAPWLPDPRDSRRAFVREAAQRFVAGGPPLDTDYTTEQRARLLDYYGPNNREAAQTWSLPLAKLGYPTAHPPPKEVPA